MFRRTRRGTESVAFAFSGGGSRGASQVGALKALAEAGIHPHFVTGTSAGAVNAAWYALHPHRLDGLEAIWMALRTQDVFPGGRVRMLMNIARQGYVHRADQWEAFLRRQVGSATFADTVLPCAVVAVRLRDGARVVFTEGEIVPALMASTAIPGVFPAVEVDGELYVDGGVLEHLPLPTAIERGATTIWAMDCSHFPDKLHDDVSVVDRAGRIAAYQSVMEATRLYVTRGRTVHLLRPELPDFRDARDFAHTPELIRVGYEHARAYLRRVAGEGDAAG